MSLEIIHNQILRFLASEAPEVMSIKGTWGVGKTYAWNTYLNAAKNQHKIALGKYSYVSLFGINSLQELKFSIFENMIESGAIGRKPSVASFKSNTTELLKALGQKSLPLLPGASTLEHYRSMIDALAFLSLEKTLICIDDFERKGRNIEAQDILGLITQLKEQKKCKVALILNDESLSADSSVDYVRLREKVIDTELRFAPTARDCVAIALSSGPVGTLLSDNVVKLKINNIRIIKKIEKLSGLLLPVIKPFDQQVKVQALRTLTLLTWCYYSQTNDAPDYNFVVSRTSAFGDLDENLALTTQQQNWCAVLRRYENFTVDDFDLQIARLVENGYIDEQRLYEEAQLLNEKVLAARSEHSFQEAWRRFNESFDDDSQGVIDCLSDSFKHNARYISPVNLDGTVRLLRHLGKDKLASRIIDLYIEKRKGDRELFSLDSAPLPGRIKDREVIRKFREQVAAMRRQRTLKELCDLMLGDEGTGEEEEMLMAQAELKDYVDLFKEEKGPRLTAYVDLCLKFARLGGITEEQKEISDKAIAALKLIARESQLNASRVRRFGVKID